MTSHSAETESKQSDWTGFYGGANLGYSLDSFSFDDTSESFAISGFSGKIPGRAVHGDSSFLAGGQIGYNQQFGKVVLGLEWDTDSISHQAGFRGNLFFFRNPLPLSFASVRASHSAELDLINTLRARAGFGWRSLLVYASGGLALADITERVHDRSVVPLNPGQIGVGSDSGLALGWAAGGGVEWSATRAISIAAEYRHLYLGGSFNPTNNQQLFNARGRVDFSDDEVILRVNTHLNAFFGH